MADDRIPSQWQLQDTGETRDEWMLHEDEQRLPEHMQLQEEARPVTPESAWQPIDYRAMQQAAARPRSRGSAALGTIIVLVLVGVAGYLTWFFVYNGNGNPAAQPASETPAAQPAAVVPATETPVQMGNAPEATEAGALAPVVPVPAPTATPDMVDVRQVTVTETYGVNARREARGTADLIRVLDKDTVHPVASGPFTDAEGGVWYEIALADKIRAWVTANYVAVASRSMTRDEAIAYLTPFGLEATIPPAEVALASTETTTATLGTQTTPPVDASKTTSAEVSSPVSATAPAATVAGQPVTTSAIATTTSAPPVLAESAVVTVSGVISAPAGLNLRRAPQTGDNVIQLIPGGTAVTLIGRSQDGAWVQAQTADGIRGWLAAGFVTAQRGLDVFPLGTTQPITPTIPLRAIAPSIAAAQTSVAPAGAVLTATAPAAEATPTPAVGAAVSGTVALPTPTPAAAEATPEPAPLPVAADGSAGSIAVTSVLGVNVRPAPSADASAVAQLDWNATATALGRSADNAWVKVRLGDGRTGWVAASAVTVLEGLAGLPVLQ